MNYNAKQIAILISAKILGNQDAVANDVCMDSREAKPGDCFFAIKGENINSHDYITNVFDVGATIAIVSQGCPISVKHLSEKAILRVPDTIEAMGILANHYRLNNSFKVVAITGSLGKTTTRNIIYHALSSKYKCYQAMKNYNNDIGLPFSLLKCPEDAEIAVLELGTNSPGEIEYLSSIAMPDIAVITNTQAVHLEGLGDIDGVVAEKAGIAKGILPNGILIINSQMQLLKKHLDSIGQDYITFDETAAHSNGADGYIKVEGEKIAIPLPGLANLKNALAAHKVCQQLDITSQQFAQAMQTIPAVDMRMQIEQLKNVTIINDCYNASPESMKNAIGLLCELSTQQNRRSVFICGPMLELGTHSKQLHNQLGKQIAENNIKLLIAVGDETGETVNALDNCGRETAYYKKIELMTNQLHKHLRNDDIILVKGSRGAKLETAVSKIKELFS